MPYGKNGWAEISQLLTFISSESVMTSVNFLILLLAPALLAGCENMIDDLNPSSHRKVLTVKTRTAGLSVVHNTLL